MDIDYSQFSIQLRSLVAKSGDKHLSSDEYLPFWMHSLDTAGIAEKLIYQWVPESVVNSLPQLSFEDLSKMMAYLGLVHDIGKATIAFQKKIGNAYSGENEKMMEAGIVLPDYLVSAKESTHPVAGEAILLSLGCPAGMASIVGSHHGKPTSLSESIDENMEYYPDNYYGDQKDIWTGIWEEWNCFALEYAGYSSVKEIPELDIPSEMLLSGLLIVADWIASNTEYFPLIDDTVPLDTLEYPERIDQAWQELHFPELWTPAMSSMGAEEFSDQFGFSPNVFQSAVMEVAETDPAPGLIILEAQMGIGKTEAALSAAEILASRTGAGGAFLGMPSQATANGIFPRVEKWATEQSEGEVHSMELIHGNAALNPDFQLLRKHSALELKEGKIGEDISGPHGLYLNNWFDNRKTGLLADFVIGTVDQYLMAALRMKHVMLRILGLVGKVVIIDECHAYDAYMNVYFDRVLNWLGWYHVPVILLSATLPSKRRREMTSAYMNRDLSQDSCALKGYPLITWTADKTVMQRAVPRSGSSKEVTISFADDNQLIDLIKEKTSDGGCAGIIANTVRSAQEYVERIRRELPEKEVMLLHSAYTMQDRADLEALLIKRVGKHSTPEQRKDFIVVGTQVLEQSLDLDFDVLFTQLCPMDLLLQRIGRLHRHDRKRPSEVKCPLCFVLHPKESAWHEGSEAVYGQWLLYETDEVLHSISDSVIRIPEDIPVLVEKVYSGAGTDRSAEEKEYHQKYTVKIVNQQRRASSYRLKAPVGFNKRHPSRNTLSGMLDNSYGIDDETGRAAVRDAGASVEAVLVVLKANGNVSFLPWINKGKELSLNTVVDADDAFSLLTQKIRLPFLFDLRWDETLREIDSKQNLFSIWKESSVLKNELFLPLDEELKTELIGYQVQYSKEKGFLYWKGESNGETEV